MNVATLRETEEEHIEVMKIRKLSTMAVCETRLRSNGDRISQEGYRLMYSGGEQARHGVAFLLEPSIAQFVQKVVPVNERLIGVDLKLIKGVSMIQVYAPQQGRPAAEKEEFYQQLQRLMDEMKYSDKVILCGDFNGHVGCNRINYEGDIGMHSIENRNEGGQRLLDFAQVNSLKIMNTLFQHRESHKWTWYRYDQQQRSYTQSSMID